jgi:hypothetical protein
MVSDRLEIGYRQLHRSWVDRRGTEIMVARATSAQNACQAEWTRASIGLSHDGWWATAGWVTHVLPV